jgi:hypothetical protein
MKYFGKYRGIVTNIADPLQIGRILVLVPDVFGPTGPRWAMPCAMLTTARKLGSALPRIGAGVWIEFEQGDPNLPIWSGCFFGNSAETPPSLRNTK